MDLLKKILFFGFFSFALSWGNKVEAQQSTNVSLEKTPPSVEFTSEDIEKIKILIEHQLNSKVSQVEFSMFGKATKENLALFRMIDANQKEDPFFSQSHISYIIQSMEFKLGLNRPKSKSTPEEKPIEGAAPKISNLPKDKSDQS